MSFAQYFNSQFTVPQNIDFCLRLIVACLCGALIGIERSRHFKEAGLRTHMIVCCGAALIMIISKYGFGDLLLQDGSYLNGTHGTDPARLAAQVVSGISFLGAGVIFKNGGVVRGLTTAAGIWVTAAIGLAIGSGMFVVALFATVLVWLLQILMHKFSIGMDIYVTNTLHFTVRNGYEFFRSLTKQLQEWDAEVSDSSMTRHVEEGTTDYDLTVRSRRAITYSELKEFIEAHEEILSCSNNSVKKT